MEGFKKQESFVGAVMKSKALLIFVGAALVCGLLYMALIGLFYDNTPVEDDPVFVRITNSATTNPKPSSSLSVRPSPSPSSSTQEIHPKNFILFTDLHIDPLYSEYAPISDFCRVELGPPLPSPTGLHKLHVMLYRLTYRQINKHTRLIHA